ncbi:hemolysin III family protein [Virgibacillus xinjiangensis]|uniref:Hemolysin III family protein n=1 Tax=Virgibacillus xinjiangensis TaxID=393090 RepID=A0ABV7CQJ5_9BACI
MNDRCERRKVVEIEPYKYDKFEEKVNAVTHGIGALLSIAALVLLVVYSSKSGNPWQIVSVSIFGGTMFLMYFASTLVHALPEGKWKDLFQIFDHSSIYLFIAGSYTPFLLVHLRVDTSIGWVLFGIVWGLALIGILFKVFFVKRFLILSTLFYILMGWLMIFAWGPLSVSMHETGMLLLILGGLSYTVGTVFYMWRGFPHHHAVWHLFVIIGSAFHFFAVFYYVI